MPEPKTIWVVEDEDRIADVIGTYLTQSGFAVERFADGTDLTARVTARPPDLILLDLMLPGADGMDLCREIRHF